MRGALVLDRSWFRPARSDQGLPPFDESPEARYNVIPDALLVNDNDGVDENNGETWLHNLGPLNLN